MKYVQIRKIADIQLGKMLSPKSKTGTEYFPYLRNQNVQWNEFNLTDLARMDFSSREREKFSLCAGDLLICEGGDPGRCAVWKGQLDNCYYQKALHRVRPHQDVADSEFLSYWIRFQAATGAFNDQNATTTIAHLPLVRLEQFLVPDLSVDNQRQVAARLKAQLAEVETTRQAAQAQLRDTRLLRARMLKAFFAELEAAPKKKLGDHAPTTSGSTPSRGNKHYWQPAEIAWVKTGEVAFAPITTTEEAISSKALAECSLTLLPPKSILIAMYGQGKTRGQSAILKIPAATNQACFAILPNETWEPDFLHLWLKASYQDLRDLSEDRGGNQANLNGALLKALEVPAPNKTEQQHLVARIQAAMTEIDAIERAGKTALEDIDRLPSRVLAQAFGQQEDDHDG